MADQYVNINGVWRKGTPKSVVVDGVYRNVKETYSVVDGVYRKAASSGIWIIKNGVGDNPSITGGWTSYVGTGSAGLSVGTSGAYMHVRCDTSYPYATCAGSNNSPIKTQGMKTLHYRVKVFDYGDGSAHWGIATRKVTSYSDNAVSVTLNRPYSQWIEYTFDVSSYKEFYIAFYGQIYTGYGESPKTGTHQIWVSDMWLTD